MGHVEETQLPGVGIRHDFTTRAGERMGVIAHRAGHRDLLIYDHEDPDACGTVVRLEADDARTLAEMLGSSQVSEELTHLQSVAGLSIDWIPVRNTSACSNRRLGDLGLSEEGAASVVAIVRGDRTIPSPSDEEVLADGDTAVAVGTPAGIRHLFELLQ
ncbi:MAG: potassium transporter TrkA [Thermoleophilia bacterium]|nr:potassium transporter TrkA [Thermoleophilia bacterium]